VFKVFHCYICVATPFPFAAPTAFLLRSGFGKTENWNLKTTPTKGKNENKQVIGVCLFLMLAVFFVFAQTARFGFIRYDDNEYVYENTEVQKGLTANSVHWAFTHVQVANWIPLTTLSHMLDCQWFGMSAGGHHLVNVLWHTANALLLFVVLRKMTARLWPSAFVAAVFAVHPLRAESVAWVSERKDVLSGFFFMLTLWAYAGYVGCGTASPVAKTRGQSEHGKRKLFYALMLVFFALGLLAKSMVATLPFVLLLLDYWPLGRISGIWPSDKRIQKLNKGEQNPRRLSFWSLVREKIPLLALSAGSCVATALVPGLVVPDSMRLPALERIGNALVSYVVYFGQMLFPKGLATPYPLVPGGQPAWKVCVAILLLAAISATIVAWRKKHPFLLTGWLWYLGMLVPVIGFVQISFDAAHSDRYTYLPEIGLAVAGTWAVADWGAGWRHRRVVCGGLMLAVIGALAFCAETQTSYWKNDLSLWTRALDCTTGNTTAHNSLGGYFWDIGETNKAIEHYRQAVKIQPDNDSVGISLGEALAKMGKLDEAVAQYRETLRSRPDSAAAWNSLGMTLAGAGRYDEAIADYQRALKITPRSANVYNNLGMAFYQKENAKEAIAAWQHVLEFDPDTPNIQNNLAWLLATSPDASLRSGAKAVALAEKANQRERGSNAFILHSLAAAYAETGRYGDAAATARRAMQLATAATNRDLMGKLPLEIKLYNAGRPLREAPQ